MNRLIYIIKAFTFLAIRIIKNEILPYHSKEMPITENTKSENAKYLHNGIINTAKGILKGECRLHWLRN